MASDDVPEPVPGHDSEIDAKPSVRYRLKSGISVAWLSYNTDSRQMAAFRDAWEPLAARAEWREWSAKNLQPFDAVLVL